MIKEHFENINYLKHRITNATTEGFNGVIQSIKANAREFRDFAKILEAIGWGLKYNVAMFQHTKCNLRLLDPVFSATCHSMALKSYA